MTRVPLARLWATLAALSLCLSCSAPATGPVATPVPEAAPAQIDWSKAQAVTVVMTEYRFVPSQLHFRQGVIYRLHLENRGEELHEFTAPDFFGQAHLRDRALLINGGQQVALRPSEQADLYFVADRAGNFDLRCADHDWAGMVGEITVQ